MGHYLALWFAFSEIREYGNHEIYFARIDGNDFCTSGIPKTSDQTKPKEPVSGIKSEDLKIKKLWKNEDERKALCHQADLDCIRKSGFGRK
ncbi:MAG: hypothetical protein YFSK_0670 [Candidatus Yanofskyibacterium parasiticum]|jgi:hypothetical protein|nr:MAG: hypothetical protein YFSK_0670 [Candidatus Yanofskybacteria bacterium]